MKSFTSIHLKKFLSLLIVFISAFSFSAKSAIINVPADYPTIQAAINAASPGDIINVAAGTYPGNVNIDRAITLNGANAGVSPCSGTRTAETKVMGAFTIAANNITINGFEFTGAGAQIASTAGLSTWSNIDIENNWLHATTAQIPIRHGLGLGGGIGTTNWTVLNNKIEDIQLANATAIALFNITNAIVNNNCISHTNATFAGRRGINADGLQNATLNGNSIDLGDINPTTQTNAVWGIQVSMSDRDATGITIDGNIVSNVYRAVVVLSQRNLTGLMVQNNEFGPVVGGVDCNTGSTIPQIPQPVQSNISIKNNNVTTVTTTIPGAFGAAVRLRNLHSATANGPVTFSNVQINENSFIVTAAAIIYEAGTGITNENATCNWYGTTNNGVITTKITGPVTYIPYLTNGTDNSAATGFQPVPASCNGVPRPALTVTVNGATVVDNNDATPDVAALGVCNTPAVNLFFTGFNDLNNIGPVGNVRVRQEFTHANTAWVGPNPVDGDYLLSGYAGGFNRQIGLVNPGAPGTLTMSFQVYYDVNNNNVLDGSDYAGDKIIYTVTVTPQVKLNTSINGTVVNSNNDGNDDNATFSVCNKPNNILFNYFADANGLSGPLVKAYQVIQTTNVTVPFCNNCSAALSAFAGATGTASLIDPTMPGTLVMKFKGFYDTDGDGQIGANECGGDWVIYTVTIDPNVLTINCPANITINCQDDSSPANTGTATGSGSCDNNVTISNADQTVAGSCPNSYTINRTWTVTDALGNTKTCVQIITVQDITNPTISCPASAIVQCASQVPAPNTASVTASDNCGAVTVSHVSDVISNQTCANRYTITRTYKAMDACGNSATCTQTITVNDNTNPTISCPAAITVQCASQVPSPNVGLVTASDNCGAVTVSHVGDVISNQTCANRYIITRTYKAMDACGNSATCTQTITVNDNTNPTISCPAAITVQCASQVPSPNVGSVTASDNCGAVTVSHVSDVISNQTCANRYTITRTYKAMDACGNSATCTQTITVNDNTNPTISCPAAITVQCASQVPAPNVGSVTASDNCGSVTVTHVSDVISNQTCANKYTVTRTYRATDACGNMATCTQTITVNDNTPPTITCPPSKTVSPATLAGTVVTYTTPVVSDNCSGVGVPVRTAGPASGSTFPIGTTTVTYQVTDACGNTAFCSFTVTVISPYCDDQKKKAYVCHNGNTLCVSINAVQAHLNHGDYLGQCTTSLRSIVIEEPVTNEFRVNVSPNPSAGAFRIQVISKSIEPISVKVMDLSGKVLTVNSTVVKGSIVLGNELRPGIYIAEVIQGTSRQVIKLVKVN